jgi:hypothetical protein
MTGDGCILPSLDTIVVSPVDRTIGSPSLEMASETPDATQKSAALTSVYLTLAGHFCILLLRAAPA